jgi:FkbM family methyltransferase
VALQTDAGTVWIPASDGVMRPYLEEQGTWEPDEGRLLAQFFRPGLRFLDVGANVGYFSLLVANSCAGAVIHAFEPHPLTSQVLALNAWSSGADITTHALALSAGDRILALTTAPSNLGDTRSRASAAATMLTPAAPLDTVLPGAVFDLVKIDVQGFETEVVAGMIGMIRRSRGVVIVAEFMPSALRDRNLDPVAVLASYEELGLELRIQVGADLATMEHVEVVRTCEGAGPDGQVNLVMTPR